MTYVDLNPIRANMAKTPESSEHTSIKRRINSLQATNSSQAIKTQPKELLPFAGNPRKRMPKGLPFPLLDYVELVDWTGRCIREDKRGAINNKLPLILERLAITPKQWLYLSTRFESRFKNLVGTAHRVEAACVSLGQQWCHGIRACRVAFPS